MEMTVSEIAERVGGVVVGDGNVRITGVNGIKEAVEGDLTFLTDARYLAYLSKTEASAILVTNAITTAPRTLIQVANPYLAFYTVLPIFRPPRRHPISGVHPSAVISDTAELGEDVVVGAGVFVGDAARIGARAVLYPGVYVGAGAVVGSETILYPNVVVREGVEVGARCIMHPGVVLGADGFGFQLHEGILHKVPQIGTVIIGDDVEIGANSAVDRATFGATTIGRGTKIDNLVQIGHNCRIGEHCTISGTTGIAGSATIGNRVTIAAQVGIGGHLEIGDDVVVAGRAGVTKSIPPGQVVSGFPAKDHNVEKRLRASERQMPDALRRLRELERRLDTMEGRAHGTTTNDSE